MTSLRYIPFTSNWRCLVRRISPAFTNNAVKTCDMHLAFGALRNSLPEFHLRARFLSSLPVYCRQFQGSHCFKSRNITSPCPVHRNIRQSTTTRYFSKKPASNGTPDKTQPNGTSGKAHSSSAEVDQTSLTVFQRFKKTYKEHGKILIVVHCITSTIWFGSFYMAAVSGFDIVPLMEKMGFSETLIKPFRAGGVGFVALAYLMYKLATPARYTATLGGTNLAIRYLQRKGKMEKVPSGQSIRNLYKDGKVELRDRQMAFQLRIRQRSTKARKHRVARNEKT